MGTGQNEALYEFYCARGALRSAEDSYRLAQERFEAACAALEKLGLGAGQTYLKELTAASPPPASG